MASYRAFSSKFGKCETNALSDCLSVSTLLDIGKLIEVTVKPNYKEATLYADDGVAETYKALDYADITLGVDEIDISAMTAMYGLTSAQLEGHTGVSKIVENDSTDPNYGTYGYIYGTQKNGAKTFVVVVLHRVLFDVPEDKVTTKGETVSFSTPSITGKAYPDANGEWRTRCFGIKTVAEAKTILETIAKRTGATISTSSSGNGDIIIPEDQVTGGEGTEEGTTT